MRLLKNHSDVYIRVLLLEQLDKPPIFRIKETFHLQHDSIFEEEIGRITPRYLDVEATTLVSPVTTSSLEVISNFALKARTKPVSLAFAVLVESSSHKQLPIRSRYQNRHQQ